MSFSSQEYYYSTVYTVFETLLLVYTARGEFDIT